MGLLHVFARESFQMYIYQTTYNFFIHKVVIDSGSGFSLDYIFHYNWQYRINVEELEDHYAFFFYMYFVFVINSLSSLFMRITYHIFQVCNSILLPSLFF